MISRKKTVYILLAAVVIVGVFGIFGLGHSALMNCDSPGSDCPQGIAMALHHIEEFRGLTGVVIPQSLGFEIAIIFLLFFLSGLAFFLDAIIPYPSPGLSWRRNRTQISTNQLSFLDWLSLFENSPSKL